ncbi:MAG TPA: Fur family transcriptional regulator [Hyphomicrobiaceae bacterium]|jgi:Fur family zinc uptake transcriptional regulator|nr:Fur family transcriptional regulator [Hyphomicrobiaceae bacterium]
MTDARSSKAFPSPEHDHGRCLQQTLARAVSSFEALGLRLTPLRRRVLEEIAGSHHAIGAYEILERLARKGGARLAPISVYRTLDVLLEAGIVHRLESRNAFFACHAPHSGDRRQIVLACERCGEVAEVPGEPVFDGIAGAARKVGFVPSRSVVEVTGACGRCSVSAGS